MKIRPGPCALVLAVLCVPLAAVAGPPKAQAAPQNKNLGTLEQTAPAATKARERSLQPLPAPEVVKLRCPSKLTYYATELANDSELAGWGTPQVRPGKVESKFQFSEIRNLRSGDWQGATSIECLYSLHLEKKSYSAILTRKIHASGTPYRCIVKGKGNFGPEVECRLSITPGF